MKRHLGALALLAALSLPSTAFAQWAIDLKAGYALPTGDIAALTTSSRDPGGPLKNAISGVIPIEVAGRYRFTPNFSAGVYFQYGIALVAAYSCLDTFSCSASNIRTGAEAVYEFFPTSTFNPWISVGTGWEWLNEKVKVPATLTTPATTYSLGLNGWEWFNVQAGCDWNVSKTFAFGPWVGFFGGQYSSASVDGQSKTIASSDRRFHGWVQFGLKGTVSL